jgi:undecaprenyl-diphosphatase
MSILQALVLGVVQGLSEFLPISSSAHLVLTPQLFRWADPGLSFDVALHLGTLAAVLIYFRAEWMRLFDALQRIIRTRRVDGEESRRVVHLIVATIPGVIGGLLLNDYAETTFRDPRMIGVLLIAMGLVLWLVDRLAAQRRALDQMSSGEALLVGLVQVLALLPGVSRSGSTIAAGRALRFDRESAATFSFLMSMPIIAGAAVLKVPHVLATTGVTGAMVAGVLASAISGLFAIAVLLRYVTRHSYGVFALYRVVIGIGVLLLWSGLARG